MLKAAKIPAINKEKYVIIDSSGQNLGYLFTLDIFKKKC